MDILKKYVTDTDAEVKGVWVDISADAKIKVGRSGTRQYSRDISKEVERYSLALEGKDDVADDTSEMIIINAMTKHILLGWEGFTEGPDNKPVPYSKEKATEYLKVKDFRKLVSAKSDDMSNFKAKQEEAAVKN